MAIKVGSVVIDLEARTASFMRGLGRAARGVRGLAAEIGKLQTLLVGGAGVAGLALATRQANSFATEMARVSARLGVSTEFLSEMKVSVEKTGSSFGTLTSSLQDMQERLEDAVRGGGEAREALDELGLSAADLLAQGGEQAFLTLLEKLREVDTESRQIFLADKLFADAGQRLVGVINQTSEALAEQAERSRELGLVISGEAATAADDLNRRMNELARVGKGFTQQMTEAMTPALNTIAQAFLNMGSAANFGTRTGRVFGNTLLSLAETGAKVAEFFNITGRLIGAFAASLQREDITPRQLFNDVVEGAKEGNSAIQEFVTSLQDIPEPPKLLFDPKDQTRRLELGKAFIGQLNKTKQAREGLNEAQREANRIAAENLRLTQDARSPAEVLADTHADLKARLDAGGISLHTFNTLLAQAQQRWRDNTAMLQASGPRFTKIIEEQTEAARKGMQELERQQRATQQLLFRTIDRGLTTMMDTTRSVKERFRDLVADITAQLAHLAAREAFSQFFPGTFGPVGSSGFSSLIGSIFGSFLPGFQRGGSFQVGGSGGGGPDSQVVAFRASPGERVDVTPAAGFGGGGGSNGQEIMIVQNLHFQGEPDPLNAEQIGAAAGMAVQEAMARNG